MGLPLMLGPFRTMDMLICGIITISVSVVCFAGKAMIGFPIIFAAWIVIIVLTTATMIIIFLGVTIIRYIIGGKEGFLFANARALGVPILADLELGSNVAEFVLGEKDNPKDVIFADDASGAKIDPSLLSEHAKPMHFPKGLDIYLYSFFNFMPQSVNNHAAFKAIEDYFNSPDCKNLQFLTIKEFVELISDPEHFLQHDAHIKLNKYFKLAEELDENGEPVMVKNSNGEMVRKTAYVRQFYDAEQNKWIEQDITIPEMIASLTEARKAIARLPSYCGPLAGTEAFKDNSVSYSSQHLSHAFMLFKDKMKLEMGERFEKIMIYAIAAAIVFIGGGIGFYLASMAPKAAGG